MTYTNYFLKFLLHTCYICLTIALSLIANASHAQQESEKIKKNQVRLEIGVVQHYLNDINFSPLNYTGKEFVLGAEYKRLKPNSELTIYANYSDGDLQTSYSSFKSQYNAGALKVKLLKPVKQKPALKIGGQYHFQIFYLDWSNQESFSFIVNHSIDLSGEYQLVNTSKWKLTMTLDIPLLSLLVRPPYNGLNNELINNFFEGNTAAIITNGKLASLNRLLSCNAKFSITLPLSKTIDIQLIHQQNFNKTRDAKNIKHLQALSFVSTNFKF